jgi:hypothetical protein
MGEIAPETAPQSVLHASPVAQTARHRGHVLAPGEKYFRPGNHASEIRAQHTIYAPNGMSRPQDMALTLDWGDPVPLRRINSKVTHRGHVRARKL